MNKIHIIMPFSRVAMKDELISLYGNKGIVLHPIVFKDQNIEWGKDWIKPFVVFGGHGDICYYKINQFIESGLIEDDDYYWCMCDDDAIESNVIPEIKKLKDDVIFISMKRGYATPRNVAPINQHPANTLIACPENVVPSSIGMEQMIIKGRIFKSIRYEETEPRADGLMAVYLKENFPIRYEPNLFVLFNYYEPGRWEPVTGIVVSHNTKDLLKKAIESVRKYHPNMQLVVVDGSDEKNPCHEYVKSIADDKTQVFHLVKNIGHGRGICYGLKNVKTPYAMIFDSDIEMIKSPVTAMLALMQPDTWGVGEIVKTDIDGFHLGGKPNQTEFMPYLHPYFCLINMSEYKKYSPFIHHGAPAVNIMRDLHYGGLSDKVLKNFAGIKEYIRHEFYGTRGMRSKSGKEEIEGVWDNLTLFAKNVTCITLTGDRPESFNLCKKWMAQQTIQPDQWIVVDDGKTAMTNIPKCDYIRREPKKNDPAITIILNLFEALQAVTGDYILIIEDDEYYAPAYVEEMVKRLDQYEAVGICHSKYYHLDGGYKVHDNVEHASLAQTAFRKEQIPLLKSALPGDPYIDLRFWKKLRDKKIPNIIFDDGDKPIYVGIKGLPGRCGIGAGHNINAYSNKDGIERHILKKWIPKDYNIYLQFVKKTPLRLNRATTIRRIPMGTYRAKTRGLVGKRLVEAGETFTWDGPKGSWMIPIWDTVESTPVEAVAVSGKQDIYQAAAALAKQPAIAIPAGSTPPILPVQPVETVTMGKRGRGRK